MNYRQLIDDIINKYSEVQILIYGNESYSYPYNNLVFYAETELEDPDEESVFTLLHEIGHVKTNKQGMCRCEEEFYATKWAIKQMKKYKFCISDRRKNEYQRYIWKFTKRVKRVTPEQMTLTW